MKKLLKLKYIIPFIILSLSLTIFTTFSANFFQGNSEIVYILSKNIYLDSDKLNETNIVFESKLDLSKYYIESSCNVKSELLKKRNDLYLFNLKVLDEDCDNGIFLLKSKLGVANKFKINFQKRSIFYQKLLDLSSKDLTKILESLKRNKDKYEIYSNYKKSNITDEFNYLKKRRIYEELDYRFQMIKDILEKRKQKYLIPVVGYKLPTKNPSKFPNARRPYRSSVTDGVHHSWDIDAPFNSKIVSLDYGIIVRIVKNWEWADLSKIRRGKDLSKEDKMRNLDIYRGNQIWIKTMKGELVMYNHLDKIVEDLKEGQLIKKGDYVGNIGTSGVPEKGYSDYHLDFSISENPFNLKKSGTYELVDYMSWPWKFKGKSLDYIKNNQYEIFKK